MNFKIQAKIETDNENSLEDLGLMYQVLRKAHGAVYALFNIEGKNKEDAIEKLESFLEESGITYGIIQEQTGAGAAGATTTATFQPAVGPGGSASKSGSFPGGNLKKIRRDPPAIQEAIKFADRMKNSSLKCY